MVYSIYHCDFNLKFTKNFAKKAVFDVIANKDVEKLKGEPSIKDLIKLAIDYSDGIIIAQPEVDKELIEYAQNQNKMILPYINEEKIADEYSIFYDKVLASQNN